MQQLAINDPAAPNGTVAAKYPLAAQAYMYVGAGIWEVDSFSGRLQHCKRPNLFLGRDSVHA